MESAGLKRAGPSLAWLAAIAAIAVIARIMVIAAGWPAFIDPALIALGSGSAALARRLRSCL